MSKEQQKDSIICVVCHQPTDPELDELVMAGFDEHGKAFAEKAHVHTVGCSDTLSRRGMKW